MSGDIARGASIQAGAIAGAVGLAVFLVLHHLWITPIWFIAPVGAVMAALGGAAVGAAYGELLPRVPPGRWTVPSVIAAVVAILAPSIVVAELLGPIYAIGPDREGSLLVSGSVALAAVVVGLLATATLAGAAVGLIVGRTRRAMAMVAVAGLALAIGPGHNIPLLGGTPAAMKELGILAAVIAISSVVLVKAHTARAPRSPNPGSSTGGWSACASEVDRA